MAAREQEGAVARVVEGDDDVVEAERQIGERHVVRAQIRQALEVMAEVVAEIAHRTALERRQVGTELDRVGAQEALQGRERVAGEGAAVAGDPPVLAGTNLLRISLTSGGR